MAAPLRLLNTGSKAVILNVYCSLHLFGSQNICSCTPYQKLWTYKVNALIFLCLINAFDYLPSKNIWHLIPHNRAPCTLWGYKQPPWRSTAGEDQEKTGHMMAVWIATQGAVVGQEKKNPLKPALSFPCLCRSTCEHLRRAACHLSHPRLLPQEAYCWCIIFKAGKTGKKEFFLWAYRNQGHICLPLPFIWYCWLSLYNTRYDEGT